MASRQNAKLSDEKVLQFLKKHPDWLSHHADELAIMLVKNTETNIIDLDRYRQKTYDQKIQLLNERCERFLDIATQNECAAQKLYQLTLWLLQKRHQELQLHEVEQKLSQIFDLAFCKIFETKLLANHENLQLNFEKPFCSHALSRELEPYCQGATACQSFAHIPISGQNHLIAGMIFGSSDPTRFSPKLETFFLSKLGELLACYYNAPNEYTVMTS